MKVNVGGVGLGYWESNPPYKMIPVVILALASMLSVGGTLGFVTAAGARAELPIIMLAPPQASSSGRIAASPLDADLSITLTAPITVIAGSNIWYAVFIHNYGPSGVSGYSVSGTLPPYVSYGSGDPKCHASFGSHVNCFFDFGLGADQTQPIYIMALVGANTPLGPMTSYFSVSGGGDTNPANNNTSAITTVVEQAELAIAKTASASSVVAGDTLIYTLTITNLGPTKASTVWITDELPSGVILASFSAGEADCSQQTGKFVCWQHTLASGATTAITIAVTVTSGTAGTLVNLASVTSDAVDLNLANNSTMTQVTYLGPWCLYFPYIANRYSGP